jgi:hypothetical protein
LVLTFHFLLAKTFKSIQWEPDFAWLQRYARWCGQPCGHRNAAWRIPSGCPWARWLVGYCSWGFNETLMGLSQPSNRVPRSSLILGKCSLSYYQNQLDNKNLCSTKHGAWSHNLSIAREWHKALAHFGPQAYGASTVAVLCLQGVPLIQTWRPPKSFGRCYISYWKLHFFWKYCVSIVNFQGGCNFPGPRVRTGRLKTHESTRCLETTGLLGSRTVPFWDLTFMVRKFPWSGKPWWLGWPPQGFTQAVARQGIYTL